MLYDHYYKTFINQNPYPRKLKSLVSIQGSSFAYQDNYGKQFINFSSSDYLGLSQHPFLIERSHKYAMRYGVGSGASRLVTGNLTIYDELETKLARALHQPAALIMGAGYQTNLSVLEALLDEIILGAEPLVFCDRFCHVSMIASTRHLTRLHRFQHNDLNHLQQWLEKYVSSDRPKFILVESVYSMEGDCTHLAKLIEIAKQHHAFLYVDDAHGVGVYGADGWGCASDFAAEIPLVMGTFSKALGSYGAYVGCSTVLREYLINKCRGLIYSTGLSPAILGAISAVIDLLPELAERRQRVLQHADQLRIFLRDLDLEYGQSNTHIVPWIIGDSKDTVRAAQALEELGILGTAIQPPTVPSGKSRIRFCPSAAHSDADLDHLMEAIRKVAIKR